MKTLLSCLSALLLLTAFQTASADDYLKVCHLYRCKANSPFKIDTAEQNTLAALFADVKTPEQERAAIQQAVLAMYLTAGRQTPIYQDKGGNFRDGTAIGRMDCADHSSNTTEFLHYFARKGWLKFHDIGQPAYRFPRILDLHYAARLTDRSDGISWVVDGWFKDFGHPPAVVPLTQWKKGWEPE